MEISELIKNEGFGSTVGRIITIKPDVIVKKDGTGTLDIFRGRVSDPSGSVGFLSWVPFNFESGDLVKMENISVRKFRDTPEINISSDAKIELYIDNSFPKMDDLVHTIESNISDLRNGMRDIKITVQIDSWSQRTFTSEDGTERVVRSGEIIDPSGRCRLTAWCDFNPTKGDFVELSGARVQSWQGSPDLVIDDLNQLKVIVNPPWEEINPENHWVDVDLNDLVNGGSRRGIKTSGNIISIRQDSGIIYRCPECRRVLRDDMCSEHGHVQGVEDLRLRFVLDNGVSNASLLLSKEPSEDFLSTKFDDIKEQISVSGKDHFLSSLRDMLFSKKVDIHGRALVDNQGTMILAEKMSIFDYAMEKEANRVMEKWGVVL